MCVCVCVCVCARACVFLLQITQLMIKCTVPINDLCRKWNYMLLYDMIHACTCTCTCTHTCDSVQFSVFQWPQVKFWRINADSYCSYCKEMID